MLAGTTDLQLFTYTAQDYDPETGLLHFYARYYDPARGVWLTQDPYTGELLNPLTQHRYAYLMGNPLKGGDLYGFWPDWLEKTWNGVKDFVSGFLDEGKNMVVGTYNMARHPIRTAKGLGYGVTHPKELWHTFTKPYVEDWNNGHRWRAIGRGTFAILPLILAVFSGGGAEAGEIGEVAGETGEIGELAGEAGEIGELVGEAGETSELAEGANAIEDLAEIGSGERCLLENSELLNAQSWQEAERLLSEYLDVPKNTQRFFVEGMSKPRIPDFVSDTFIADSKWYQASTLSQSAQLRDFARLALEQGKPLYIFVRQDTHVTAPALRLIQSTGGNVIRVFK